MTGLAEPTGCQVPVKSMTHIARRQQTCSASRELPSCSAEEIRSELRRVRGGRVFVDAQRLQDFLTYIVEESLAGRAGRIKGLTIAQDVFRRGDPEDAQTSTIVRVEAGRLRRRLIEYYADEGRGDPVRIEVPKGAYVPNFEPGPASRSNAEPTLAPTSTTKTMPRWMTRRVSIARALTAVVIVVGLLWLTWWTRNDAGLQTPADTAPPISAAIRPTIAVLPFNDQTGNGTGELLAAGLTEDIITDLSNLTGLNVIAQSSVAAIKGQDLSPQQMAEKLGVSYVLRGSVRGTAPNHRVTAQLYDARTDRQIWAERFDRDLTSALEFQDELAVRVVQGMSVSLRGDDLERFSARHSVTYEAEALYRQAMDILNPPNDAGRLRIARQAFQRTIEIDPGYAGGYAGLAYTHVFATFWGHSEAPEADLQTAVTLAEQSLAADPSFGLAYTTLAFVELIRRDFAAAVELSRTALEVRPADPYINIYHAYILAANGQAEQGIPYAERALHLDPLTERAPYLNILGFVSFHAGEYQRSLDAFRRNQERGGPSADNFRAYFVAANVALGRLDEARTHLHIRDGYGEGDGMINSPVSRFRHPEEAAEQVRSRIRELRAIDAAISVNDG